MTRKTGNDLILDRLAAIRGDILAQVLRSRETAIDYEKPPEQPYTFFRQRVENPGNFLLELPSLAQFLRLSF